MEKTEPKRRIKQVFIAKKVFENLQAESSLMNSPASQIVSYNAFRVVEGDAPIPKPGVYNEKYGGENDTPIYFTFSTKEAQERLYRKSEELGYTSPSDFIRDVIATYVPDIIDRAE